MIVQIDNQREWVQFWIEDEEWLQYVDQWWRENVSEYRRYDVERGVVEIDISG